MDNNLVTEITQSPVAEDNFEHVWDAQGRTVIPGLSDAHVHVFSAVPLNNLLTLRVDEIAIRSIKLAETMLMNGFTTIRDAGGMTFGLKRCIDDGTVPGPRIYPSHGMISQTCGHADMRLNFAQPKATDNISQMMGLVIADGVTEVRKAVREQLFLGASQIKIMAGGGVGSMVDPIMTVQYSLEELKAAVDAAEDYGTYVMAHIYTPAAMQRAAQAGVKCFDHATLLDDETARIIKDKGIWLTPGPQFAKVPELMKNPQFPEYAKKKAQFVYQGENQQTELINKYELDFLFGTDAAGYPEEVGKQQRQDLGLFKKRFGSFAALRSATGNMNRLIKLCTYQNPYPEGKIGVLEPGAFADLLIVDGNPVENIDVLMNPDNMRLIMKDGKVYKNTL